MTLVNACINSTLSHFKSYKLTFRGAGPPLKVTGSDSSRAESGDLSLWPAPLSTHGHCLVATGHPQGDHRAGQSQHSGATELTGAPTTQLTEATT